MSKQSFPEYFNANVAKLRIIDKKRSWFMRLVNFGLTLTNALKLSSIEDFMTRYITTIGHVIYASEERGGWSMQMDPNTTLMHELTHLMGFHNDGFIRYSWRYLTSKRWRAEYESRCVQAQMLYDPSKQTIDHISKRAQHFVPYGIQYEVMAEELHKRLTEIEEGKPHKDARQVVEAYESWQSAN